MMRTEYELYPIPHAIEYYEEMTSLNKEIQLIYDETIDEVTKNKIESLFLGRDFSDVTVGSDLSSGKINVLVGTKGSRGFVDNYVEQNMGSINIDYSLIDAYQLEIANNNIVILGKDTDAAFYGAVTLESIIEQSENHMIRNLSINDYADTEVRGFIEGFYGIPWSNKERMELMRFGSQFKTTSYIFAPKDDPFHRENWDKLYPKKELEKIREMAKVGNEVKTRFVWTISPLVEVASIAQKHGEEKVMELLKENTDKLLEKFEQLYSVGVRQFGVLGDDVGALPLNYVITLMNAVSEWTDAKGDVYDTIYTPAAYNSAWAWDGGKELNAMEQGFANNIHIHWTGASTVAPITQSTVDFFKEVDNKGIVRRNPLFWLNWPVNDIDYSLILLGKGEMLTPGVKNLAGVVTNPMQEAEASKISIFAVADYSWNTIDFNDEKSWKASLKYIEPKLTEELAILANHMTYADPEVGLATEESEDIKEDLDFIITTLSKGQSLSEYPRVKELINELQKIANAGNEFLREAKNEQLKIELEPFVKSLRDTVLAAKEFIEIDFLIEMKTEEEILNKYSKAKKLRLQSLNYERPILTGQMKAKAAQKRLQPFADKLEEMISTKVENQFNISLTDNS